jgi:hypothetical protein
MVATKKITFKKNKVKTNSGRGTPTFSSNIRSQKKLIKKSNKPNKSKTTLKTRKRFYQSGGDPDKTKTFTDERGQSFSLVGKKLGILGKASKKIRDVNVFATTPLSFVKTPENKKVWDDIRNLGFFSTSKSYMKRNIYLVEKGIEQLTLVYHLQKKMRSVVFALEKAIEGRMQLIYNTVITKEDFENKNKIPKEQSGGNQNPFYDINHLGAYQPALTVIGPSNYDYEYVVNKEKNPIYRFASKVFPGGSGLKSVFEKLSLKLRKRLKTSGKYIRYELDKSYDLINKLENALIKLIVPLLKAQRGLYLIYREANLLNGSLLEHYKSTFTTNEQTKIASLSKNITAKEARKAKYRPLLDAVNKHFLAFKKDYMMILEMYDSSLKGFWIQDQYGRVISRFSTHDSGQITNAFIDMLKSIDVEKYKIHIASNMMGELYKTISNRKWTFIIPQPQPTYFEVRVVAKERFCYSRSMVQYYVWELLLASQSFNINPEGILQNPNERYIDIKANDQNSYRTSLITKMLLSDKTLQISSMQKDNTKFITWAPNDTGFNGYLSHGAIMGYYDDDLINMGVSEHPIRTQKREQMAQQQKASISSKAIPVNQLEHTGGNPYMQQYQQQQYQQQPNVYSGNPYMQQQPQQYQQQPNAYSGNPYMQQQYQQQNLYKNPYMQPQSSSYQQQPGSFNKKGSIFSRNTTKIKEQSNRIRVGWMDIWREHYVNNFNVLADLISSYLTQSIQHSDGVSGTTQYTLEQDVYYQYWRNDIHLQFVKAYTGCGMLDALYRTYIHTLFMKSTSLELTNKAEFESKLTSVCVLTQIIYAFPMMVNANLEKTLNGPLFQSRINAGKSLISNILKTYYDNLSFDGLIFTDYLTRILPLNPNSMIQKSYTIREGAFINFIDPKNTEILNGIKILAESIASIVYNKDFNPKTYLQNLHFDKQISLEGTPQIQPLQQDTTQTTSIQTMTPNSPIVNINNDNLWYLQSLFVLYDSQQEANRDIGIKNKIISHMKNYFKVASNAFKNSIKKTKEKRNYIEGQPINISLQDHFTSKYYTLDIYSTRESTLNNPLNTYNTIYTVQGNVQRKITDASFKIYINPRAKHEWVSLMSMFTSHFSYNVNVLDLVDQMTNILNTYDNNNNSDLYSKVMTGASEAYRNHLANSYAHLHHKMLYYLNNLHNKCILGDSLNINIKDLEKDLDASINIVINKMASRYNQPDIYKTILNNIYTVFKNADNIDVIPQAQPPQAQPAQIERISISLDKIKKTLEKISPNHQKFRDFGEIAKIIVSSKYGFGSKQTTNIAHIVRQYEGISMNLGGNITTFTTVFTNIFNRLGINIQNDPNAINNLINDTTQPALIPSQNEDVVKKEIDKAIASANDMALRLKGAYQIEREDSKNPHEDSKNPHEDSKNPHEDPSKIINRLLKPTNKDEHTPVDFLNITILSSILGITNIEDGENPHPHPFTYATKKYIKQHNLGGDVEPGTLLADNMKNENYLSGLRSLVEKSQSGGHKKTHKKPLKNNKSHTYNHNKNPTKRSNKTLNKKPKSHTKLSNNRKHSQKKLLQSGQGLKEIKAKFAPVVNIYKYIKGQSYIDDVDSNVNVPNTIKRILGSNLKIAPKFDVIIRDKYTCVIPVIYEFRDIPDDIRMKGTIQNIITKGNDYMNVYYSPEINNPGRIKTHLEGDLTTFKKIINDVRPNDIPTDSNTLVDYIKNISDKISDKIQNSIITPQLNYQNVIGYNFKDINDLEGTTYERYPYQKNSTMLFPYQIQCVDTYSLESFKNIHNYTNNQDYLLPDKFINLPKKLYNVNNNNFTQLNNNFFKNRYISFFKESVREYNKRVKELEQAPEPLPQPPQPPQPPQKTDITYYDVDIIVDDMENRFLKSSDPPTPNTPNTPYEDTDLRKFTRNRDEYEKSFSHYVSTNNPTHFQTNFPQHHDAVVNGLKFINIFLKVFKTELELSISEFLIFNGKLYNALYGNDELYQKNKSVLASGVNIEDTNFLYNKIKEILEGGKDEIYSDKWGEYANPVMKFQNHILRDWTNGNFRDVDGISDTDRAITAIKGLLYIPQFNMNDYNPSKSQTDEYKKLQQKMAKDLQMGESDQIPYGYAYYHFIIHTMIVQRLKQKEIMALLDPSTESGKNHLQKLGFTVA